MASKYRKYRKEENFVSGGAFDPGLRNKSVKGIP